MPRGRKPKSTTTENMVDTAVVTELLTEYKSALSGIYNQLTELMDSFGSKFEVLFHKNKATYDALKKKEKSVELARMINNKRYHAYEDAKDLLDNAGWLGLNVINKLPSIDPEKFEELSTLAKNDELKPRHITQACKNDDDLEDGQLVKYGKLYGTTENIDTENGTVDIVLHNDGSKFTCNIDTVDIEFKLVPQPKCGSAVVMLDPETPSLYNKVGILDRCIENTAYVQLIDPYAEVETKINCLRKATTAEFAPIELSTKLKDIEDRLETLIESGASNIQETPLFQQLKFELENANKELNKSESEKIEIIQKTEKLVKTELINNGWVPPDSSLELTKKIQEKEIELEKERKRFGELTTMFNAIRNECEKLRNELEIIKNKTEQKPEEEKENNKAIAA